VCEEESEVPGEKKGQRKDKGVTEKKGRVGGKKSRGTKEGKKRAEKLSTIIKKELETWGLGETVTERNSPAKHRRKNNGKKGGKQRRSCARNPEKA